MGFSRRADAWPRRRKGRPDMGRDEEESTNEGACDCLGESLTG
jgi:hypothetical protein